MRDETVLSYASVRPGQGGLVVELMAAGAKVVLAQPPPRWKLWREVIAIVIGVVLIGGIAAIAFKAAGSLRSVEGQVAGRCVAAAVGVLLLTLVVWDWWQNGGVVTEIHVNEEWLVWSKVNLWGGRTYQWPRASITRVASGGMVGATILRVHRRGGLPLTAFSGHATVELNWAASALSEVLGIPR